MKRELVMAVGSIFLGGLVVLVAACGSPAGAKTTQATATATATARATVAPAPTSSAGPSNSDLMAQGKLIFEKTAGGMGCTTCHGLEARGAAAPYIRGASLSRVREALSSVSAMSFIKLSDQEITAVVAYLKYLGDQP
ncbi:MAG: cytochrome c [Chloroflexi bacterium]|nr:cytochrome c [Chloroflexota bacterium]